MIFFPFRMNEIILKTGFDLLEMYSMKVLITCQIRE